MSYCIAEVSAAQRRDKIVGLLNTRGRIRVLELAAILGISEITIRHDLADLEVQKKLSRVCGGAESICQPYYTLSFADRFRCNETEKRAIAAQAAALVNNGDTIMLDGGTTTLMIAQELRAKKGITVITNSLPAARELSDARSITVVLLGGSFNSANLFYCGAETLAQLEKYNAERMFMAADGISVKFGVTTYVHPAAEVTRRMAERTASVIAVADHTKIGRDGFTRTGDIRILHKLITNRMANAEALNDIARSGVEIVTV